MATIKSYTDLEQSKKLAEILPLESADMRYAPFGDTHPWMWDEEIKLLEKDSTPCWSLASLLNVLPNGTDVVKEEADTENEKYMCTVLVKDSLVTTFANNLVDVCVEMILKLHEQKLL